MKAVATKVMTMAAEVRVGGEVCYVVAEKRKGVGGADEERGRWARVGNGGQRGNTFESYMTRGKRTPQERAV